MPFFDLANADLVISFGANFLETWLSPVAYTRGFAKMRRGDPKRRGYFIQFEAQMSQTAAKADEWIPLHPGTEGLVALAIGKLAAEAKGAAVPRAFASVNIAEVVKKSGVNLEALEHVVTAHRRSASPCSPSRVARRWVRATASRPRKLCWRSMHWADNFGQTGRCVSFAACTECRMHIIVLRTGRRWRTSSQR